MARRSRSQLLARRVEAMENALFNVLSYLPAADSDQRRRWALEAARRYAASVRAVARLRL